MVCIFSTEGNAKNGRQEKLKIEFVSTGNCLLVSCNGKGSKNNDQGSVSYFPPLLLFFLFFILVNRSSSLVPFYFVHLVLEAL